MAIKKNLTDPDSRDFWESVDRTAAEVASWPAWKRGEIEVVKDQMMTPEQTAEQMIFVTPVLNEWAVCIKEKDNSWELSAVDTKDFADRLANIYRGVIARAMKQAVAAERARVTHELTHCHKCEASLPVTSRCGECGQDQMLEDED